METNARAPAPSRLLGKRCHRPSKQREDNLSDSEPEQGKGKVGSTFQTDIWSLKLEQFADTATFHETLHYRVCVHLKIQTLFSKSRQSR